MFKTAFKILVLIGVTAYLIFALTTLNHPAKHSQCIGVDITVTDTTFLNEDGVRQILINKKLSPEGLSFDDIHLAKLESCLVASSLVRNALCYQTPEGKVAIRVTPRKPILHVLNSDGDDFYIDDMGGSMPRQERATDLVVMTGNVPKATAPELYARLGMIINADTFWRSNIEEIHVDNSGEIQLTPRLGSHIIILGDTSAVKDKLHRMRLFYDKAIGHAGWNRYKTISLKYDNQIVCTKWE